MSKTKLWNIMKIKTNPDFTLRKIAGERLLIPTGEMASEFQGLIALNETACEIWEFLAEEHTEKEICENLAAEYGISMEESQKDVERFLKPAIEKHLLKVC